MTNIYFWDIDHNQLASSHFILNQGDWVRNLTVPKIPNSTSLELSTECFPMLWSKWMVQGKWSPKWGSHVLSDVCLPHYNLDKHKFLDSTFQLSLFSTLEVFRNLRFQINKIVCLIVGNFKSFFPTIFSDHLRQCFSLLRPRFQENVERKFLLQRGKF